MTGTRETNTPAAVISGGHGGEHGDMRARVHERRPELLALAERLLGVDPFARLDGGTAYLQPAIYCASVAGWDAAGDGASPVAFAGHSLGEFAAVVLAGAMSAEDGLRMVVTRGRLCARAAVERPGGMLILKAGEQTAAALAERFGLCFANDNAPNQTVLSGPAERIAALEDEARRLGVRGRRLATAVAFHSDAVQEAADGLGEALQAVDVVPPRHLVVSAASAKPFTDIRSELAHALVRPVRWRSTLHELRRLGAGRFVETGPGRVLTGLVQRTLPDATAECLEDRLRAQPAVSVPALR